MPGPVCPACGVAVVPGYVKCPKCHAALPYRRAGSMSIGGTTVQQEQKFPLGIVMLAIALVAIDVYWTVRDDRPPHAPPAVDVQPATQPEVATPTPVPLAPTPTPD